jgi:hypothetical protein
LSIVASLLRSHESGAVLSIEVRAIGLAKHTMERKLVVNQAGFAWDPPLLQR